MENSNCRRKQFDLRKLLYLVTLAALVASLFSPAAVFAAGFVVTYLVLLVLQWLVARV